MLFHSTAGLRLPADIRRRIQPASVRSLGSAALLLSIFLGSVSPATAGEPPPDLPTQALDNLAQKTFTKHVASILEGYQDADNDLVKADFFDAHERLRCALNGRSIKQWQGRFVGFQKSWNKNAIPDALEISIRDLDDYVFTVFLTFRDPEFAKKMRQLKPNAAVTFSGRFQTYDGCPYRRSKKVFGPRIVAAVIEIN